MKKPIKKEMVNWIQSYLRSDESIITRVFRLDNFNDYPPFFHYTTHYESISKSASNLLANGISTNEDEAKIKAIMETIERWYLLSDRTKYGKKVFELSSETGINKERNNRFLSQFTQDSQGAAAAFSQDKALYRGICELIERDAFAIYYYNKLTPQKISYSFNKKIQNLITVITKHHFKITLLNLTLDIPIPICLCIVEDITGIMPRFTLGLKCSSSWNEAVEGAILEAMQSLSSFRSIAQYTHIKTRTDKTILRLSYWFSKSPQESLSFFYGGEEKKVFLTPQRNGYGQLRNILSMLFNIAIPSVYWRMLYHYEHIYVVKTNIPQLVSLPLDEKSIDLNNERIFSVPVSLGLLKEPRKAEELNNIMHPFP